MSKQVEEKAKNPVAVAHPPVGAAVEEPKHVPADHHIDVGDSIAFELSEADRALLDSVPALNVQLEQLRENALRLEAILKGVENIDFSRVQRVAHKEGDPKPVNMQGFLEVVKEIH